MKIGFFGGCFNPPTNVHIDIAKELIKTKMVDKIVFIPVGDFYKKDNLLPIGKRCKMLEFAIENEEKLDIDDFEKDIKNTIFAKDAFEIIKEKYKNDEIYFIMGSDNFLKMETWKNYSEIIDIYRYIIIKRENINIKTTKDNLLIFTPKKQYNFDSTAVRKLIKENKNTSNLLNPKVNEYIKGNKLYI